MSNTEIIKDIDLSTQVGITTFLQQSTIATAEFLTGVLASDQNAYKLSAGRLLQSVVKNNLFTQLGREIAEYRSTGIIKEDYFATHKNQVTLLELLKFIDEDVPDEELFKAAKSIFFTSIGIDSTPKEEMLAYEFMTTIRKLSGTEILILKANYEIATGILKGGNTTTTIEKSNRYREYWRNCIARQMGEQAMHSVIDKYEVNLEELGIINRREHIERAAGSFTPTSHFRLTEIGVMFCGYISKYE